MYLAFVETRSWAFEAAGASEVEAMGLLNLLFLQHMRDMGGTLCWSEVVGDAYVREITVGGAWIDGQQVTT